MSTQLECKPCKVSFCLRLVDSVSPAGAVWERSLEAFRNQLTPADVVHSKGQGKQEGLLEVKHNQLCNLLVSKCDLLAAKTRIA